MILDKNVRELYQVKYKFINPVCLAVSFEMRLLFVVDLDIILV